MAGSCPPVSWLVLCTLNLLVPSHSGPISPSHLLWGELISCQKEGGSQ